MSPQDDQCLTIVDVNPAATTRTLRACADAAHAFPGLLRVGFLDALAYRAEFLVWVLAYTTPIIMLALWTAVARDAPLGSFDEQDFQAYFMATLVVRLATGTWVVWEMNTEVRQGLLQRRLLWPLHPLVTYLAGNVAALPLRLAVALPIGLGALWWLGPSAVTHDWVQLTLVPLSALGAFLLMFFAMAAIGTLSLYWESSLALFDLWLGLYTVFSGYVMPLELFPAGVLVYIDWLPFRSMLAFPVENLLGRLSRADSLQALAVQWGWIVLLGMLTVYAWRRGVRRFSAYGG